MSDTDEKSAPRGWLGGTSQLPDAGFWRARAADNAADLATMKQAVLELRARFGALDLPTSLRALAALAEGNHAFARLLQTDDDAVTLLREAGVPVPDEVMVVFPGAPDAVRGTVTADGAWVLDGTQARSVHAAAVNRALVVAATADGDRLFQVVLDAPGVVRDRSPVRTIAPEDPNGPVTFTRVPAEPVGSVAWWAGRDRSFVGLLRDAACWLGTCVWLCRAVEATLAARTDRGDLLRVGRVDVWVHTARLAMRDAVPAIEADPSGRAAELGARRAVAAVVTTADTVIRLVASLSDARVSRQDVLLPTRVAQLQIALRRFDSEENLRAIGRLIAGGLVTGTD